MKMVQANLLTAACTVAVLAATPVLAQSNVQPGDPGVRGNPNMPAMQDSMPGHAGSRADMDSMHRSRMDHQDSGAMRSGRMSESAMVDRLNQQSYEAAQRGQAFGSGGSSDTGGSPSRSGGMNDGSVRGGKM
jgi:hypothetical protein